MNRENFLWCFIGHNKTGKTATARQYALTWKKQHPGMKIWAFDPQNKFSDVADIFIDPTDKECFGKMQFAKNCLLILDDYRMIHPGDKIIAEFYNLLSTRGSNNADIMIITHAPGLVLTTLTYMITHYFLFYTQATKETFDSKIPNFIFLQTAQVYINRFVRDNGKGTWPNFPHIIIDNMEEKLTAINMKKP